MQKIIQFVIRNRLLILIIGLLILASGYYSYRQLPVDAFPDVTPVLVQVFTETEGLAPEEVEKYVTYPIEVSMNGLPDLKEIRSISNFGLSVVNIYFEDKTAFYFVEDKTNSRSQEELRTIQDWLIKFNLQTVPGVTEVLSLGGDVKQFQVQIRPPELLRYNLSLHEVLEAVKANNSNTGAQFIVKNAEEFIVRSVGLSEKINDLERIVLKSEDGTPVFLGQVAAVVIGGELRRAL